MDRHSKENELNIYFEFWTEQKIAVPFILSNFEYFQFDK